MKLKRNIIPKYIGIALLILLCLIFLIPDLSLRAYVFLISPKAPSPWSMWRTRRLGIWQTSRKTI